MADTEDEKDPLEILNDTNSDLAIIFSALFMVRKDYPGNETLESQQVVAAIRATARCCRAIEKLTKLEVKK